MKRASLVTVRDSSIDFGFEFVKDGSGPISRVSEIALETLSLNLILVIGYVM